MEIESLYSTHEEVDSRMLLHIKSIPAPSNVVIRTVDTDVLIIELGCLDLIDQGLEVWMETGVYSKNTLRYISVNNIYAKLGSKLCKALPAFHAFTGCDYTACFSRKGKVRPFKLLEKNDEAQEVFGSIGEEEKVCVIEKFVCQMYGMKHLTSTRQGLKCF